jgi:Eukaryotic aspartyl protease
MFQAALVSVAPLRSYSSALTGAGTDYPLRSSTSRDAKKTFSITYGDSSSVGGGRYTDIVTLARYKVDLYGLGTLPGG